MNEMEMNRFLSVCRVQRGVVNLKMNRFIEIVVAFRCNIYES